MRVQAMGVRRTGPDQAILASHKSLLSAQYCQNIFKMKTTYEF